MSKFVVYLRVSTARQGQSGLGLEAQRDAVARFTAGGRIVAEFVEVESGKRNDRPEIAKAFALCRVHGAKLVIAKLDRLARNVAFIANLMEADVDFIAVDMPQANKLTVHILAAMAEHEREMISARTKAALAAAKARGTKLGGPIKLTAAVAEQGRIKGRAVRSELASRRATDLTPILFAIRAEGFHSARALASELNNRGIPTPGRHGNWQATTVQRVLTRLSAAA
jgi:DNA invertase Pin-like site-specific DNA recombinase